MFSFLSGIDLNKIIIYVIGIVIAIVVVVGGYFIWKHNVEKQIQLKFNNEQLQQVVKDQQKYIDQLNTINKNQEYIIANLSKQTTELNGKLKDLDGYLNSNDARKDDRPASKVLRQTLKDLIGVSK